MDRLTLQSKFEEILGNRNVYFQAPEGFKMKYPAIRYSLSRYDDRFADNILYASKTAYTVTLIDKNPDSDFVNKIRNLPYCRFDRPYTSDNLNHWVFTIYV